MNSQYQRYSNDTEDDEKFLGHENERWVIPADKLANFQKKIIKKEDQAEIEKMDVKMSEFEKGLDDAKK